MNKSQTIDELYKIILLISKIESSRMNAGPKVFRVVVFLSSVS
jgi:hypothetical protein